MKKFMTLLAFIAIAGICSAQTFSPDVVTKHLTFKKDNTLKGSLLTDVCFPVFLKTPALQLSFTQVEKINGTYKLSTPLSVGYSYIFSYANGIMHQDSSITIESHFFFGAGANFGVKPNENGTLVGSLPVGAIVGYSRYGIFGGIDALNGKPMVAVSLNLLNFPVLQGLTKLSVR